MARIPDEIYDAQEIAANLLNQGEHAEGICRALNSVEDFKFTYAYDCSYAIFGYDSEAQHRTLHHVIFAVHR